MKLCLAIVQFIVRLTSNNSSSISYNGFSSLALVVCVVPEIIPYFSGWVVGGWEVKNIAISSLNIVEVEVEDELGNKSEKLKEARRAPALHLKKKVIAIFGPPSENMDFSKIALSRSFLKQSPFL